MKNYFAITAALLMCGYQHLEAGKNICPDWKFQKGDAAGAEAVDFDASTWETIELPHTYNPSGSAEVYREQQEEIKYQGPAWYRKNLFISNDQRASRLFLRFDAAYLRADVYLNGKKLGRHDGGFTAFCFEITDAVKYGVDNLIAVRVNNEFNDEITPLGGGYVKFGGITRPVWLIEKSPVCISPVHYASSGVYCRPTDVSAEKAEVEVDTIVNAPADADGSVNVVCFLKDASGNVVARESKTGLVKAGQQWAVTVPMTVSNPDRWHGLENPALYELTVQLYHNGVPVDQVVETTGFKTVSVDRDKGFFLNGKSYPLYGCAQHQHYPGVGSAMRKEHFDRDAELMKELGMNFARFSHYPHSAYRFDLCDRDGIVSFTELALIGSYRTTPEYFANCMQQITEMVYQLYNHPSIAIWGLFNEIRGPEINDELTISFLEDMNNRVKTIDPSRLTCSVSWKTAEDQQKRNDIAELSGWNRYQGWYWNAYEGGPDDFSWIDAMREEYPKRNLGITEYGAGGAINHFDEHRRIAPFNKDQFHPQDYYNWNHEEQWKQIQQRPWLWGTLVWTMSEFLVPGYDQGRAPTLHDKALIAADRKQFKDAFYFYKANWNPEPMLHLCDKPFDVRLLDHAEITAYSNLKNVSLRVNGKTIGTIEDAEYGIYRWKDVPLAPGSNLIEVSSGNLKQVAAWHRVTDIHNDAVLKEIVPAGSEWTALLSDSTPKVRRPKFYNEIPGADDAKQYDNLRKIWEKVDKAGKSKLPLVDGKNWTGKAVYMKKTFTVDEGGVKYPQIFLKQTARLSQKNPGRILISIDGRDVLTIEEGCDGYRLIPINVRCGPLNAGEHTITVVAEKPPENGVLDIGLVGRR